MPAKYNRRDLIRTAAQTLIAAPAFAAGARLSKLPLIRKIIPSTGEHMPAIGLGTSAFRMEDYAALKAELVRMHELGGTVLDSGNTYGDSETVIGQVLTELGIRKQMFVTTKFNQTGFQPERIPVKARDKIFGRESFERSLQRLQSDYVDVLFAHHLESVEPLMPLLHEYKSAGKTRYIGMTSAEVPEHADLADKMRRFPVDFIQVDYSLENRDAAATILPLAMERKLAVMIDVPMGGSRGSLLKLAGDRPLPPWAADIDVSSWSQFFLKYVISHPAVTSVIPGSTKVEHLVDNQLAGRGRLPNAAMRKRMEEYWDSRV
jgi:aryl-alcohol dehydrogenase-like predicted oxidoreductase